MANIYSKSGEKLGEVLSIGTVYEADGALAGVVLLDGRVLATERQVVGHIDCFGRVYTPDGAIAGRVYTDGGVWDAHERFIGYVTLGADRTVMAGGALLLLPLAVTPDQPTTAEQAETPDELLAQVASDGPVGSA